MNVYILLTLILIANILQIPQVQKFISWAWVHIKWRHMKALRFIMKWSRRLYYGVFG